MSVMVHSNSQSLMLITSRGWGGDVISVKCNEGGRERNVANSPNKIRINVSPLTGFMGEAGGGEAKILGVGG